MKKVFFFLLAGILLLACDTEDGPGPDFQLQTAFAGDIPLVADELTEGIPVDRNISLTFTAPLDAATLESGIEVFAGTSKVPVTRRITSGNRTVNISASGPLLDNQEYSIEIRQALRSDRGATATPMTLRFKTLANALEIVSLTVDGEEVSTHTRVQNVPRNLNMAFTFSTPVDLSTFDDAFSIPGITTTYSASPDNREVLVTAASPTEYLKKYRLTLSDELKSAEGGSFPGFSLDFYTQLDSSYKFPEISDEELLTTVQEQTFSYFWDFAHPVSGLIRERNTSNDLVTIGGSGFGVMAILVGIERQFITRQEGVDRLEKIVNFLENADRFHGVWPHWMNGITGTTIPFSANDDGADLVETAFMIQGLLTARQYLSPAVPQEQAIRNKITQLWEAVEWDWFTQGGENVLYWHWSPNVGFAKNLRISGWNESLIVYVLAAASPTHPIEPQVYHQGWANNGSFQNGKTFYGEELPLGPDRGGPLFFSHYSFLGLDPRNLADQYANYWEQNVAHSRINAAYSASNPLNYVGYSEACWGLTASDNQDGYSAHSPNNDLGVITPTAALSSMPYTPEQSTRALRHFYYLLGDRIWGPHGFYDAFNITENWYARSYLAIDQGPIIVMIENHRSALLWDLFMQDNDITEGLDALGFTY